jgi:hypothetical protein
VLYGWKEKAGYFHRCCRPDYRVDYRHIVNVSLKLRAKEKIRFIDNWGL